MTKCKCGHDAKVHVDGNGPCCDFSHERYASAGKFFCKCRKFEPTEARDAD